MNILRYLREGKENATTRRDLMILTGLTDRANRQAIEIARQEVCISNEQDGRGYYITNDPNEIERQGMQDIARGLASLERGQRYLKLAQEKRSKQMSVIKEEE